MGEGTVPASPDTVAPATSLSDYETHLLEAGRLATIGALTRTAAHEINNPLLAILGLVDFVMQDVDADSEPHEFLGLIRANGHEIKHVVEALLGFVREPIEERRVVSLAEIATDTVALARRISPVTCAAIVEDYTSESVFVNANASQIKQVLLHLMRQTERAMLDGATLTITVARERHTVLVRVAETGTRAAHRAPIARADAELDAGMALADAIVRRHGGELFRAAVAPSTDLAFRLPLHDPARLRSDTRR